MLRLGCERLGLAAADEVVETGYPILLEAYGAALDVHTRLYPGAAEAVLRLAETGVALGICTNKPEGLAKRLVAALGLDAFGAAIIGADTLPVRKPDPAPFREAVARAGGALGASVLVGDTITDRETARAAGVPCVLVTFGPDGEGVRQYEPEAVLPHFGALEATVERLLAARRVAPEA